MSLPQLRPMLAAHAPEDLEALRLPMLVSAKLDGIRCLIVNGVAVSRTLKPIRNAHIQRLLGKPELNGLDGELIVGSPTAPNCMQVSTSGIMSADGEPDFRFFVFDQWNSSAPFAERRLDVALRCDNELVIAHEQSMAHDIDYLEQYEANCLDLGYEGVILRAPSAPYKFNRSTVREQGMLKLKRFVDAEAMVVGYEERMHNANEAELDERGFTKRSTHQENQIPTGMLGALVVALPDGTTFRVGTGFDEAQRRLLWAERQQLVGRVAKFKSFPVGVKDRPRHPVFLGFRDREDL